MSLDGRVQRGARTRASIVGALLDMLSDGLIEPTSQQIADRAGVSVRSIFQHFEDIESLYDDMARAQAERTRALFETLDTDGDLDTRIDQLCSQRSTLYEHITPVRHALGTRARTSPAIGRRLDETSVLLRSQVEQQFAPDLDAVRASARPQMLDALDLLWSFDSWDRLRTVQGLSVASAETTLSVVTAQLLS